MRKILVVEDQMLIRRMICDTLEEHGFQTVEAADGMEGLNLVECEKVSLVVTDLVMPNYDGVDFLTLLRSCHPELEVISMTSLPHDHPACIDAAKLIGNERLMSKTDNYEELALKIKSILNG